MVESTSSKSWTGGTRKASSSATTNQQSSSSSTQQTSWTGGTRKETNSVSSGTFKEGFSEKGDYYVTSGGRLIGTRGTKARTEQRAAEEARNQAIQQANFQSTTGQVSNIPYNSTSQITSAPEQNFSSAINYTSAYGYSTPTGYVLTYPSSAVKSSAQQEFEQYSAQKSAMAKDATTKLNRDAFAFSRDVGGRGFLTGANIASKTFFNTDLRSKEQEFIATTINPQRNIYTVTPPKNNSRTSSFVYGVKNAPNVFVQNPIGEGLGYTEAASIGVATGAGTGAVFTRAATYRAASVAAKKGAAAGIASGVSTMRGLNIATGAAFAGYGGYQFYTDPYRFGVDVPKLVVGGAGFAKGLSSELPRATLSVGRSRYVSETTPLTGVTPAFTSTSKITTPYSIKMFDLTARGKATTDFYVASLRQTTKTPSSITFEVAGTSKTAFSLFKQPTVSADYTGFTRVTPKDVITTLSDVNTGRTFTSSFVGGSRGGTIRGIGVRPQGNAFLVSETMLGDSSTRVKGGKAFSYTYRDVGVITTTPATAAETALFRRGFKNIPFDTIQPTMVNRRGQIAIGRSDSFSPFDYGAPKEFIPDSSLSPARPVNENIPSIRARSTALQEPIVRPFLEVPGVRVPSIYRSSFFSQTRKSAIEQSRITNDFTTRFDKMSIVQQPSVVRVQSITLPNYTDLTGYTPETVTAPKSGVDYGPTTRIINTPQRPPAIVETPPGFPPFIPPALPLFGIGGRGRGGGASGRARFKYVPSLTAGALGIRGPKPKGFLTPLSVRPIVSSTRKRLRR